MSVLEETTKPEHMAAALEDALSANKIAETTVATGFLVNLSGNSRN